MNSCRSIYYYTIGTIFSDLQSQLNANEDHLSAIASGVKNTDELRRLASEFLDRLDAMQKDFAALGQPVTSLDARKTQLDTFNAKSKELDVLGTKLIEIQALQANLGSRMDIRPLKQLHQDCLFEAECVGNQLGKGIQNHQAFLAALDQWRNSLNDCDRKLRAVNESEPVSLEEAEKLLAPIEASVQTGWINIILLA